MARENTLQENAVETQNADPQQVKKHKWDKAVDGLAVGSEAMNIGIALEVLAKWAPALFTIGSGFLSTIAPVADPLIYLFKSLIRLTRLVGRKCFGIKFHEEKNGVHPWQTAADIISLTLFTFATLFFCGVMIAPPIGITVAWAAGLAGLTVVGHFDYAYQEKLAKEKDIETRNDPLATDEEKRHARSDFITKRNSNLLFIGLLVGLAFLLICGSAAVFAPPALAPILYITSKVASGYLGLIAVGRFVNWLRSDRQLLKPDVELKEFGPVNNPNLKDDEVEEAQPLLQQPVVTPAVDPQVSLGNSNVFIQAALPPVEESKAPQNDVVKKIEPPVQVVQAVQSEAAELTPEVPAVRAAGARM